MIVKSKVLLIFIVAANNGLETSENIAKSGNDEYYANKTIASAPVSVDSRFFDLGQLFSPLFSNFNQDRPAQNPGTSLPQNPQFQLDAAGNLPQGLNQGNSWGNPYQGNLNPPQNQGFNPQGPNGPNQWQNPQTGQGGIQNPTYSNYPSYQIPGNNKNAPNWRPEYANQNPNQFQNQGGSNGLPTQIQPPDQGQEWTQSRPNPNPGPDRPNLTPDPEYHLPNNGFDNNPLNNNQYPGQDPNQSWPNGSGGGTLDDIMQDTNNGSGNNAILGKPVVVPSTTVDPDRIFFNNTTESPLQRQCVQDCPATPEYNPICGTNNVTYFNPGKFICARNCGVPVYVARRGVCVRRPM